MATNPHLIVLAGGTGNLGGRIASNLVARGATVRALVRHDSAPASIDALRRRGVTIAVVDFARPGELAAACAGAGCVVSALSGLRSVIVDAQAQLLDAAVAAGVPRFIPSDYCIDFTALPEGSNRNLDLRREFHRRLAGAAIAATSIFNGAFADMLTGQAPIILFARKRVLYWGSADQPMDFTTIDDVARVTAAAALDPDTPRYIRVAGNVLTARDLAAVASQVTGERFRVLRAGGLGLLAAIIRVARTLFPAEGVLYPPWQGMQYLHNMFGGRALLQPLDNGRFPEIAFTSVSQVLAAHLQGIGSSP